jgi:hypothetical protein
MITAECICHPDNHHRRTANHKNDTHEQVIEKHGGQPFSGRKSWLHRVWDLKERNAFTISP